MVSVVSLSEPKSDAKFEKVCGGVQECSDPCLSVTAVSKSQSARKN